MEELGFGLFGLAAGWVGAWLQSRRSGKPGIDRAARPNAICTCGDGFGFHDRKTRRCNAEHLVQQEGSIKSWKEWRDCRCLFYDGPEPYPEYFAPDLASH